MKVQTDPDCREGFTPWLTFQSSRSVCLVVEDHLTGKGIMKGSVEVAKGRVEEAAGVLTNNEKLRVKGQTDQAMGRVKQAAESGVRQARNAARKSVDKAKDVAQKAVDKSKG
jgi:uncharacterized protein YjbJ (UPF0337 family)